MVKRLKHPALPTQAGTSLPWSGLSGAASALAIAELMQEQQQPLLILTPDVQSAERLEQELGFFLPTDRPSVLSFPDWETLPFDVFSPLPELISQRLSILNALQSLKCGALILPITTLMQRLCPPDFLHGRILDFRIGDQLNLQQLRDRLTHAGYACVSQVMGHGEFAVRGALFDLFPMGAEAPYRIDLFDDEIDSIRHFDPESQRSGEAVKEIKLFPAREFPTDEEAISRFRQNWRTRIESDPRASLIYQEISEGRMPGGIEYYLPLFFDQTATLFDHLPKTFLCLTLNEIWSPAESFWQEIGNRYEQLRHNIERPLLPPEDLFLSPDNVREYLNQQPQLALHCGNHPDDEGERLVQPLPPLSFNARTQQPAGLLQDFLANSAQRILFIAESRGRREQLLTSLRDFQIQPKVFESWADFLAADAPLGISVAPIDQGFILSHSQIALIPESALLGERIQQRRRRKRSGERDSDLIVRNLTELHIGAPVVHEEHGVGRYLGLQSLTAGTLTSEFLTLEYAKGDKLYVPVSDLHRVSRYTGVSPENAPLHRLGSGQWEKVRRKAAERARDVAAELLDIHARRAANQGFAFAEPGEEYLSFAAAFPFEETPDQQFAIDAVISDLTAPRPMDRVICGDVGFGKTEVALRAAFVAVQGGRQVAILAPTTLLVQQHFDNIADRFADWPIRVDNLSRFRTTKQQKQVLEGLKKGDIDIIVGTHKLLSKEIQFKRLGLVIIDEEQRFGVRHKEQLKSLRANIDLLTLTATPIPRTLNMAMAGLRDLSIIATPPAARHPIKTFVSEWNDTLIADACRRELRRGGQIYFLHNEVESIGRMAEQLGELLPEARIAFAHGQMRESALEHIMRDFYHQRYNLLVSTTIIESGIDIPNANTIIIHRADKLGLAQLHQLRGRVGRSHHRAYAYLLAPSPKAMTADAKKRLEAIEALEDLGAGFTLATHDMEIRGAGELLGEEQSGQIQEIGFGLYTELLDRAVKALKSGKEPDLAKPLDQGTEVDLGIPALLPEDYLPDVHMRLVQYKRIAGAVDSEALRELQVEMIDRFGLLPDPAKNLFAITELRLRASDLGIRKLDAQAKGGRIVFDEQPKIDPAHLIQLLQKKPNIFKLDGQDKLKFFLNLDATEERAAKVRALLDELAA